MFDPFADLDEAIALLKEKTPPPQANPLTTIPDPFAHLFSSGPVPIAYRPSTTSSSSIPVFSSIDIDIWGPPQSWGYEMFVVEEARETGAPMVADYDMEVERLGNLRPIHRYSRKERFVVTALNLLGNRSVPKEVMKTMEGLVMEGNVWERVRERLKKGGYRKYYNSIPFVLRQLGVVGVPDVGCLVFRDIVNDFVRLSEKFDRSRKERCGRTYFPNIRFVALKLFDVHGIEFGFEIPKVRTVRKKEKLEEIWSLIY